jgi:hypothetical protein
MMRWHIVEYSVLRSHRGRRVTRVMAPIGASIPALRVALAERMGIPPEKITMIVRRPMGVDLRNE